MSQPRRADIGLALDDSAMAVVFTEQGVLGSATTVCDGTPESIAAAIAELVRRAPSASRVAITLCRPLVQCRIVRLPRMSRATVESVLTRDWTRHVIGARSTPHDATAREISRGGWSVAFAPADVLDALARAAEEQGWRELEIQIIDDALAGAARALHPASRTETSQYVVVCDNRGPTDAAYVRNGDAMLGRRFLRDATDDDVLAFIASAETDSATAQHGRTVILLGDGARASTLARTLGAHGHRAQVANLELPPGSSATASIAAAGMLGPARLPLAAAATRTRVAHTMRRFTWQLAFATTTALVVAFALARTEVSRKLTAVQRQRADISAQVRRALDARTGMEGAADVAAALADRERFASRASATAAAIAIALPRTTSLTVLSIAGDSVLVEGESPHSAEVYEALRGVSILDRLRLAAPLRQERPAPDVVVERFAFSARLRTTPGVRVATP